MAIRLARTRCVAQGEVRFIRAVVDFACQRPDETSEQPLGSIVRQVSHVPNCWVCNTPLPPPSDRAGDAAGTRMIHLEKRARGRS